MIPIISQEEDQQYQNYINKIGNKKSFLQKQKPLILILFLSFLFVSACIHVSSYDEPTIQYRIYFDSASTNLYETKERLNDIYQELCNGIDEDSEKTIVRNHLSLFENVDEHAKVSWKQNRLRIKIGDGKGEMVDGIFTKPLHCMEKVKPRSLLAELFHS